MTTAHRPTWKAAVGQSGGGGWTAGGAPSAALSVLDMPGHTTLKVRTGPQVVDREKALKESLLKLQQAEREAARTLLKRPPVDPAVEEEGRAKLLKQTADVDEDAIQAKYDDGDASDDGSASEGGWGDVADPDGDDDLDASSDDDGGGGDDDDDDEDEEAALQAELAKIRAEREAIRRKEEEEAAAEQEEKLEEAALLGNPLLAGGGDASLSSGKLKRRWNEDVVFRNQAKGEPEIKKRFINDTVRNDFHKRFLNKFIR